MSATELPPLRDLTDDEKSFIHYNPNTQDLVDFIQGHALDYALQCIAEGCTPTDIRVLRQANVDLAAESERNRVDAERYRWLCDNSHPLSGAVEILTLDGSHVYGERLDGFVSAALKEAP